MPGNGSRIWFKARNFGLGLRTVTSDMKTPLYMHDGSAATLGDAVDYFVRYLKLTPPTPSERADLIAYLRSL